jgi:hypothetical protein
MGSTPQFKVFTAANEYVASIKYLSDAAAFVSVLGEGATVRSGHAKKDTIWTEGITGNAYDSYDEAAEAMQDAIENQRAEYRRIYKEMWSQ